MFRELLVIKHEDLQPNLSFTCGNREDGIMGVTSKVLSLNTETRRGKPPQ
jgi:hypothetical protein